MKNAAALAAACRSERGFSLLEVVIAIAILALGILGLAGLQARAHLAEAESYSRAQALILMGEMANRVSANLMDADEGKKGSASEYNVTTREFGVGTAAVDCSGKTGAALVACNDLSDWHSALRGSAVQSGGALVGGIKLARGCVVRETVTVSAGPPAITLQQYVVSVAWAGMGNFGTVPADRTCGSGLITNARRVVSVTVPIADLGGT